MKNISDILIKKLTSSELSKLCDSFDDGSLESVFYKKLYLKDHQNNPKKYTTVLRKIK